jgi:hypothetical protein
LFDEVATDEAIAGSSHLQSGKGGVLYDGSAVLLDEGEHAEDAAYVLSPSCAVTS